MIIGVDKGAKIYKIQ